MLRPLIAVAVLMLCAQDVQAGSQAEQKHSARQIQCERMAMGEWYRAAGFAGRVLWWPREQMVGDEPKDAIHVRDDGETDEEKENWSVLLLSGWNTQDKWMAEHEGRPRDPREGFVKCLEMEDS